MAAEQSGPIRARVAAELDGEVLKGSFGSGLKSPATRRPSIGSRRQVPTRRAQPLSRPDGGPLARPAHPDQRRLAGGCHLNRPIQALIKASGLELAKIASYHLQGPKTFGYMYEGVAANPDLSPQRPRPATPERESA